MKANELYDIESIVRELETFLLIDGRDYGEKDINIILSKVRQRLQQQYALPLSNKETKITDPELEMSSYKNNLLYILKQVQMFHSQLSGYFANSRYTGYVTIRPENVSYLGFDEQKFLAFLKSLTRESTFVDQFQDYIKDKFSSITMKIEKKLILIMIVAGDLGFNELVSVIAEIFYYGGIV